MAQIELERITKGFRSGKVLDDVSLSADTGRILGISARTVDEHVAHACARLGVRTRVQAVARSILLGIL